MLNAVFNIHLFTQKHPKKFLPPLKSLYFVTNNAIFVKTSLKFPSNFHIFAREPSHI